MDINKLPEDCVAEILSRTSARDILNFSGVSSSFRSVADSDFIWDRFLPSDYREMIYRSGQNLTLSTKELYRLLCQPLLIDNGKKIFKIEKSSGLKSCFLSARELSLNSGENSTHWSWNLRPDSRFSEVAELRTSQSLEIQGKIRTQELSANTRYGAYLVMKMSERAFGLDLMPCEVRIKMGNKRVSENMVFLDCPDEKKQLLKSIMYGNRAERVGGGEGTGRAAKRADGWTEVLIGEFEVGKAEEVEIMLREVRGYQLKGGVIVDGIEVRPKH